MGCLRLTYNADLKLIRGCGGKLPREEKVYSVVQKSGAEACLYYYGARYYDPSISLWLSVDPLAEQTMTPYQYVYQNPVMYTDPTGMKGDHVYEMDEKSGDIKLKQRNNDNHDTLVAKNGDVIADNIDKKVFNNAESLNIKNNGLQIAGSTLMTNNAAGYLLRNLSVYIQKEISWGFYKNKNGTGLIDINPYQYNTSASARAPQMSLIHEGEEYNLAIGNHTHPAFYRANTLGQITEIGAGGMMPSSTRTELGDPAGDIGNAGRAREGNYIWSRYGVSYYSNKSTSKHDYSIYADYQKSNSVMTRDYVRKNLGWKKTFTVPK